MAEDVVIRAEGLGKKYLIGHHAERERYVALRDVLARGVRGLWRKTAGMARGRAIVVGDTVEEFWALRDVSFEVKRGEVLGIIGRNGAGKSTLLKILSRITEPSEGRVTIDGRVASLLEVGTGFHPELTGRENIYLNGAILGMTRAEIRRKFDEIVAFAEVEKFLDTPVKRYSSGMYVRLAFAVAAHLEPEILVVDEVLAVGDAEFQKKCLGKMSEVAGGGRTVLFVSHNMAAVQNLCKRCIGLRRSRKFGDDNPTAVINQYLYEVRKSVCQDLSDIKERQGDGRTRFTHLLLMDSENRPITSAASGGTIKIKLVTTGFVPGTTCRISIGFSTLYGACLFICSTELTHPGPYIPLNSTEAICQIQRLPLGMGRYRLTLFLEQNGTISDWIENGIDLLVDDRDFFGFGKNVPAGWEGQTVLVDHSWDCSQHETSNIKSYV
jgi:lipopolysaccharide transport system ATP-binding protein